MDSFGMRRHHSRWFCQMCPCTCRLNLVEQSCNTLFRLQGRDSSPWQPEKGMKLQWTTCPAGARRAGTAVLEKHLFAVKSGFQKPCSHLAAPMSAQIPKFQELYFCCNNPPISCHQHMGKNKTCQKIHYGDVTFSSCTVPLISLKLTGTWLTLKVHAKEILVENTWMS